MPVKTLKAAAWSIPFIALGGTVFAYGTSLHVTDADLYGKINLLDTKRCALEMRVTKAEEEIEETKEALNRLEDIEENTRKILRALGQDPR